MCKNTVLVLGVAALVVGIGYILQYLELTVVLSRVVVGGAGVLSRVVVGVMGAALGLGLYWYSSQYPEHIEVDSLSKFEEVLQKDSQELNQEDRRKVPQQQAEVTQPQAEKQAKEWETARLYGTTDQDRLTNLTQDEPKIIILKPEQQRVSANPQQDREEVRQVQDSVRLMVGTEELLKENGFLKTGYNKRPLSAKRIRKKWYSLVGKLKRDDPLVKLVPIKEEFSLTIQPIPNDKLKLKVLVGSSGELEKDRDYKISKSRGATSIIFTNRDFLGEDVLAVVEVEN